MYCSNVRHGDMTEMRTAQLKVSGLVPRAQYIVGVQTTAVVRRQIIFQAFRTISLPLLGHCQQAMGIPLNNSCVLPTNITDTLTHVQQSDSIRLMSNGDAILIYDLPDYDKDVAHQFSFLINDALQGLDSPLLVINLAD